MILINENCWKNNISVIVFKTECLKFNTKFPVYQFIDLSSFVYVYLSKEYVHACFKIIIIYLSDMYLMPDLIRGKLNN